MIGFVKKAESLSQHSTTQRFPAASPQEGLASHSSTNPGLKLAIDFVAGLSRLVVQMRSVVRSVAYKN
jgi:hypothetical protein